MSKGQRYTRLMIPELWKWLLNQLNIINLPICDWITKRYYDHYNDVIMTTMASKNTSLTVVYSTAYSDADQRNYQSSASLAFVWGIHRDRWIPRTKGQLNGNCYNLMTSSWFREQYNIPQCHRNPHKWLSSLSAWGNSKMGYHLFST